MKCWQKGVYQAQDFACRTGVYVTAKVAAQKDRQAVNWLALIENFPRQLSGSRHSGRAKVAGEAMVVMTIANSYNQEPAMHVIRVCINSLSTSWGAFDKGSICSPLGGTALSTIIDCQPNGRLGGGKGYASRNYVSEPELSVFGPDAFSLRPGH